MGYYCTVPQCTSTAGKTKFVKFHRYPRDQALAKEWDLILMKSKPHTKFSKVCSLHFKATDYKKIASNDGLRGSLRNEAVPSQKLPVLSPDGALLVFRKSRISKDIRNIVKKSPGSARLKEVKLSGKSQKGVRSAPRIDCHAAKTVGNVQPAAAQITQKNENNPLRMIRRQKHSPVAVKLEREKLQDLEPSEEILGTSVDIYPSEEVLGTQSNIIHPSIIDRQIQVVVYPSHQELRLPAEIGSSEQEMESRSNSCSPTREQETPADFQEVVVKQELDIGPEELQPTSMNYVTTQFTEQSTEQADSGDDTISIQQVWSKRRLFHDSFREYGFTYVVDEDGTQLPKCTSCSKVLSNEAFRPYRMKRHQKLHETKKQSVKLLSIPIQAPQDTKQLKASYEIALLIAMQKKHSNIGQSLIKSCVMTAARIVDGYSSSDRMQRLMLADTEMEVLIDDMARDIKDQVLCKVMSSPCYAIFCDECVDVGDCAQLIVYVRCANKVSVEEELLYTQPLSATTTAEQVFDSVSNFISKHLNWDKLVAVCTHGPGMLGPQSNFVKGFKTKKPSVLCTHCVTDSHALASITMPQSLLEELKIVVDVVNYVKRNPFNSRLFAMLCEGLDDSHKTLLFGTEFRWLSRGNVLARVYELKREVAAFLEGQNKKELLVIFENEDFGLSLAYLADVFEDLNALNLLLHGGGGFLNNYDCFQSFVDKLEFWIEQVASGDVTMFPRLDEALQNGLLSTDFQDKIKMHLSSLKEEFDQYFVDIEEDSPQWMLTRDPFAFSELPRKIESDDLNFQSYPDGQWDFQQLGLEKFWLKYSQIKPNVGRIAMFTLIPFSSTYLCEMGFSALLTIKSEYREKYDIENELRLSISEIEPRIDDIISSKLTS